jgi:hypothetical protein
MYLPHLGKEKELSEGSGMKNIQKESISKQCLPYVCNIWAIALIVVL